MDTKDHDSYSPEKFVVAVLDVHGSILWQCQEGTLPARDDTVVLLTANDIPKEHRSKAVALRFSIMVVVT